MLKKLFTCFLLFALTNYLFGCYTLNEISDSKDLSADNCKVTQLVLKNGNVIKFDKNGGSLKTASIVIEGNLVNGNNMVLPLEEVYELRKTKLQSLSIDQIGSNKITEVISNGNRLFKFNAEGGNYIKSTGFISGLTEDNKVMKIRPIHLIEIHTEQPQLISKDRLLETGDIFIARAITQGREIISFDNNGANIRQNVTFVSGKTTEGSWVSINTEKISNLNVKSINWILTGLCIAGLLVAILLIVMATSDWFTEEPVQHPLF